MKNDQEQEQQYGPRPTAKPAERIPGRLIRWEGTDYMEFQPQQKSTVQTRSMLRETKQLSYYRNEGKRDSSYSLHVNVSGDEQDPAAVIIDRVQTELAPLAKKEVKLPQRVKYLADEDGLKVWHRKQDKRLCCYIEIDTAMPATISSTLLKTAAEINKIIQQTKF